MRRDPAALREALLRVAAGQAGHFSAAQARKVGYSYQAQHYHVRRGDWARTDRGVFRLPWWPAGAYDDLVRWTLWSRGRAVVSHASALAVHDLGDVVPARTHLTVPPGFPTRAPAPVALHEADLPVDDVEQREGFAVTTPVRSILDSAATLEVDHLTRVIEDATERGLVRVRRLRARSDEFGPAAALAVERATRPPTPVDAG